MAKFQLWTDGSSNVNTGIGGWAFCVLKGDETLCEEQSAPADATTNNRMELQAVIEGLKRFDPATAEVTVYSDSGYVVNCFNKQWYIKWRRNGWISGDGRVKNVDLWNELLGIAESFKKPITWKLVKGHADHVWNNRCDVLAGGARKKREAELKDAL